ncbi:hypothetical protein D1831_12695 [Lactiplantibacillus garii]|uniref:Uncharacterized protein n=1 Tax=Lactiplantibacillus garii TaxID=2306423 RepID=A0A3R8KZ98_9LACO|nr:hypothetical protein [Lactiplantibacillus garii]RRK09429.1 hypothetical protein D1831_12695 [Lactiplantibacillus garii]
MLALKIEPGIITSRTIEINGELAYTIVLTARRYRRSAFKISVTALTLLGATTIRREHFTDLTSAREAFQATVTDLQHLQTR